MVDQLGQIRHCGTGNTISSATIEKFPCPDDTTNRGHTFLAFLSMRETQTSRVSLGKILRSDHLNYPTLL